jgi:glycosyltransferase involved in cell wall biosynthesis
VTACTTACLFGTYDRGHSANRLLALALAGAGFAVRELHEPLDAGGSLASGSLARVGMRWAAAARRLVRRWRAAIGGAPPLVVVGFGGQLDVLLARAVCRPRAGLVFAPLVGLVETLVDDRRLFSARGPRARALGALDRLALRSADLVLVDTTAHAACFVEQGAPGARLGVWHLGAEPEFFAAPAAAPVGRRVLFYGTCLPLHGIETIIAAAARLGSRAEVVLIGDGPERPRLAALARTLDAPVSWRPPVPLAQLPRELAAAAVVLGVFGTGRKAAVVVPNKVYQAAAVGRPLVTREGPGLREVFEPGTHCLACPPGDPEALAAAISRLLDDPALAARLGRAARARMVERFAPERQAAALGALLRERLGIVAAEMPRRAADA